MRTSLPIRAALVLLIPACFNPDRNPLETDSDAGSGTTSPTSGSQPTTTNNPTSAGDTTSGPSSATDGPSTGSDDATTAEGAPEISVRVEGTEVMAGGTALLSGTADVDAVGDSATVTIANSGDGPLSLGGVIIVDGNESSFDLDGSGAAGMVGSGETTEFQIAVTPQSGGLHSLTVEIANDDEDEGPFAITFLGHSTPNTYRPLLTGTSPQARFNAGLANLQDGRLLLFGGTGANSVLRDDTWVFDLETETWTELNLGTAPSPREGHAMAFVGGGRVMLFGGADVTGGLAADTWLFSTSTDTWTNIAPVTPPPARTLAAVTSITDGAILFGGMGVTGGNLGDTWRFDGVSFSWENLEPSGAAPTRRDGAMAWDGLDTVLLYGGYTNNQAIPDAREYSIMGNAWGPDVAGVPGPRGSLDAGRVAGNRIVVYAGKPAVGSTPAPGTFGFDPDADAWTALMAAGEPMARHSYAMASVGSANKLIIFGGQTQANNPASAVSATYEYVGPLPPAK